MMSRSLEEHMKERSCSMRAAFIVALVQIMAVLVIGRTPAAFAQPNPRPGSLQLTVLDAASRQPTPARVELLDKQGESYVARDALPVGGGLRTALRQYYPGRRPAMDTGTSGGPINEKSPQPLHWGPRSFYSLGKSVISLPPGTYELKVFKGVEYRIQAREIAVRPGETTKLAVNMSRWINMPETGLVRCR